MGAEGANRTALPMRPATYVAAGSGLHNAHTYTGTGCMGWWPYSSACGAQLATRPPTWRTPRPCFFLCAMAGLPRLAWPGAGATSRPQLYM